MQKLEAMQKPSFQHTLLYHSCIYQVISIKSYLSSHFESSDINIWDVCICSKHFKTILSARNYSVSIGTITPFPALVILWKSMHLVVYALQVLISLLQLWSKLGKLSAKVFLCVKRWRQTRHNVLNDGTKCLTTANVACLHVYQSQWMSRAAKTLKQTLLGIQFCWNLVTRVFAHHDLEEIDSLLQRFRGQIRSNGIAFAHLAQTSANHQGTKNLFGLCIDWLLVETWSGERSAELVSNCEARNPNPTLKTWLPQDRSKPETRNPIETWNPKPETDC